MRAILIFGALVAHSLPAAAAPTWCKDGDEKPSYDAKSMYTEADAHRALENIVAASCYPESDVAAQTKQIATLKDQWSKKLGLAEADWADVNEWAHLAKYQRDPNFDVKDRTMAWSAYSAIDQYALVNRSSFGAVDGAYLADAFGAKLSQAGRLAFLVRCLDASDETRTVAYAMCAGDAAALDRDKLAAEVRADTTHGAADRMAVRIAAFELAPKLVQYQADVKAMKAKDPGYAKMFDLAAAAQTQWAGVDTRWVQLAADLDDARVTNSRKASAGCEDRAIEAWGAAVGAMPAKRIAGIHYSTEKQFAPQLIPLVVASPAGYLAALAVTECAALNSTPDYLSRVIGYSISRWPGFRGPRTAAETAILEAGVELDDRSVTLAYPEAKRDWIRGDGGVENYGVGGIASVKVDGATATVTFAKVKVTQTRCTKGHQTSQISQIMSDGTVVYYYQCDAEVTETIEVEPNPPMKIRARYAAGLKAGMSVQITDDIVVFATPKGKATPSIVTGVEVK